MPLPFLARANSSSSSGIFVGSVGVINEVFEDMDLLV